MFLQAASKLLVDLSAEMKARGLPDKQGARVGNQLYLLTLELSSRIEQLVSSVGAIAEEEARKRVEETWIALLDGLHKLEALIGPVELSTYLGNRVTSTSHPIETMGPKVFLSYSHSDSTRVELLRRDLIAKGLDLWWDHQILPGEAWELAIRTAIEQSAAFVVCFSKNVDAKTRSGIFPEVLRALEIYRQLRPGSIFLIPIRLNECDIPRFTIDGTRDLADLQHEDLFPDSRWNEAIDRLVHAVQRAAGKN